METPIMEEDTRVQADARMRHIIQHCVAIANQQQKKQPYNRPVLVQLTHDYALSDYSKTLVLSSFFLHLDLPLAGNTTDPDVDFGDPEVKARLFASVNAFADYLLENFFMALKAAANKTPQLSPIAHAAIQKVQDSSRPQSFAGTPERVSALRHACLVRDRYRCVISQQFDIDEARLRLDAAAKNNEHPKDDDGNLIRLSDLKTLEVAHILPHSLNKAPDSRLSPAKDAALDILNMFDSGVVHLIEGAAIDRPFNAISLTLEHHKAFGAFRVYFERVLGQSEHTYRIGAFKLLEAELFGLPVIRTFNISKDRNIDPPSSRLLAIHRAIGHILHLSAAGDYIDQVLLDAEEYGVRSDGSTPLGLLLSSKLNLAARIPAFS